MNTNMHTPHSEGQEKPTWMLWIGDLNNHFLFVLFETGFRFGALVGLELLNPLKGWDYRFCAAVLSSV